MEIIESENLVENAARRGEEIRTRTADWTGKYAIVGDVRGMGLLWGIEFVKNRTTKEPHGTAWQEVYARCLQNGLRLVPNRVCPPLIITSAQLHEGLDILEDAVREVDRAASRGSAAGGVR
jgi:4-aminobutyrate aminotransferase-like enzyme